jgi:hypothetical protein
LTKNAAAAVHSCNSMSSRPSLQRGGKKSQNAVTATNTTTSRVARAQLLNHTAHAVDQEEGHHLSSGRLKVDVVNHGLVRQPRHEERAQRGHRLPGARAYAHGFVDRRPEDGGHHEVPPPAPEVVQRRRHVRPVELWLYLHAEHAAGGGGAGEEEVHEAVDVDAVQSEAHVEVHPVLELVDLEQGGVLGRAGNERHRFSLGDLSSSFVRTAVAASELDGKQRSEDERENWEGRLERAVAGSQEEELEHAQPSEEEARRAPDVGREGERQGGLRRRA